MEKKVLDVTCAIIISSSKVLVTQRSDQMSLPLKWEFPGGKLKAGETPEECIKREVREELNIDIETQHKLANSIHDYGTIKINLIPFISCQISGDIQLAEHRDAKWVNRQDLVTLDWAPADLPILKQLLLTNYV